MILHINKSECKHTLACHICTFGHWAIRIDLITDQLYLVHNFQISQRHHNHFCNSHTIWKPNTLTITN